MLIRFRGKSKTFDYVSAGDILSDRIPREEIEGKIVFVGTTASGMKEFKATPFDPIFPGVEVHASVVDNILRKDFLSRPKWAPGLESLLALVSGLLSAFILAWTGAGWSSLLLGGAGVSLWQTLRVDVSDRKHLCFPDLTLNGVSVQLLPHHPSQILA